MLAMPQKKPAKPARTQNRATNISLYPLSPDEAMRAVLSISKEDVKRIMAKRPGGKKR